MMSTPDHNYISKYVNVFGLLLLCLVYGGEGIKLPANMTIPALVIFGDSIVDQGSNNNIQTLVKCNFPPYGKDFLGGIPTGRFTNAKTPGDLVADEFGIKDILPAYGPDVKDKDLLTGVSFASGGSGYDPQTAQIVSVVSLPEQFEMYKEYIGKVKGLAGEEGTNFIFDNAVFLVVSGSDDLANTYYTIGLRKRQYNVSSYTDLMIASASEFVQELYKSGARRIGLFGAPPIGCLPSQRTLGGGPLRVCVDEYNKAAMLYNRKLSSTLVSLSKTLAQSRLVYIDIYTPLLDIIQNPRKYDIDVVDRGCCGTGNIEVSVLCNKYAPTCLDDSKYLFWDSYHPTQKGYSILVNKVLTKVIDKFV